MQILWCAVVSFVMQVHTYFVTLGHPPFQSSWMHSAARFKPDVALTHAHRHVGAARQGQCTHECMVHAHMSLKHGESTLACWRCKGMHERMTHARKGLSLTRSLTHWCMHFACAYTRHTPRPHRNTRNAHRPRICIQRFFPFRQKGWCAVTFEWCDSFFDTLCHHAMHTHM